MANAIVTKDNTMSLEGATVLVNSVKDGLKLVSQGYLAITPDVAKLYDCKGFKALGYKNFDELCAMEFGMSHGTTVGIRKVFGKFGSVTKENKYLIPEKYLEYGYTKLLFMTDAKFDKAGINPLEIFTPDMTIAQMRDTLANALEDKSEKEEAEAIDTTATEVTEEATENVSRETSIESETEVSNIDVFELSYLDRSSYALEIVKTLKEEAEKLGMKPEKSAIYDAIIANLKETDKEFKKLKKN